MGKKVIYGLLLFTLLVASGTAAWLYFGDLPKKTPIKAKQVLVPTVSIGKL